MYNVEKGIYYLSDSGQLRWKKLLSFLSFEFYFCYCFRWVNSLDPSLKLDEWTEEEDLKLKSAIDEHGYSWSKVAACVPPRTDNQCRRYGRLWLWLNGCCLCNLFVGARMLSYLWL